MRGIASKEANRNKLEVATLATNSSDTSDSKNEKDREVNCDGSPRKLFEAFLVVLALSIFGDALSRTLNLPVPGSLIGLVLLTIVFACSQHIFDGTTDLFAIVSPHFTLFFVPAATGIVTSVDLFGRVWFQVAFAIVAGTILTICVTGAIAQFLLRGTRRDQDR